jgi:hypothetical protein
VWQGLRSELQPLGLEVVTVALDVDPEDARPSIEAAAPEHPSLIDAKHVVGELFGISNVPSGVWIDEEGMIVRPPGPAYVSPSLNARIRGGMKPPPLAPDLLELVMKLDYDHELYLRGLRDWAEHGAESEWAHSPDEVIARSSPRSDDQARAAAHFELGEHLHELGDVEAAQRHWREAHRLQSENWTYKRQAWHLVAPGEQGPNSAYDGYWLHDVKQLGAENYYPPIVP